MIKAKHGIWIIRNMSPQKAHKASFQFITIYLHEYE